MWIKNKNGRRIFNRNGEKGEEGKSRTRKKLSIPFLFRLLRLCG
jgi:hypothetical protein